MRMIRSSLMAVLVAIAAGCSSTASRIDDNQALFNSYPVDVQQQIRAGQVGVGFTPEQVTMALGKPDRAYTRQTEAGSSEVWAYTESSPALSFGLGGFGFGGGSTAVGGGVGVGTGGKEDDKVRVVFASGHVVSVERTVK